MNAFQNLAFGRCSHLPTRMKTKKSKRQEKRQTSSNFLYYRQNRLMKSEQQSSPSCRRMGKVEIVGSLIGDWVMTSNADRQMRNGSQMNTRKRHTIKSSGNLSNEIKWWVERRRDWVRPFCSTIPWFRRDRGLGLFEPRSIPFRSKRSDAAKRKSKKIKELLTMAIPLVFKLTIKTATTCVCVSFSPFSLSSKGKRKKEIKNRCAVARLLAIERTSSWV